MKLIYPDTQEDISQINYMAWFYYMMSKGHAGEMGMFVNIPEDTVAETNEKIGEEGEKIYRDHRGQEWVHKVCEMNLVPFSRDSLHGKIVRTLCEVKTSKNGITPFQVEKRNQVQYYIFLDTYQNDTLIKSLGVIPCAEYWSNCNPSDNDTMVLNETGQKSLLMDFEDFLEMVVRDYIPQISETVGEGMTFKGTGWDRYGVEAADGTLLAGQLPYEIACELVLMRKILDNKEGVRDELKNRASAIYGALKTKPDPPGQVECIVYAMFDMLANLRKQWFNPKSYLKFWPNGDRVATTKEAD